jgi:hypothetical protein
METILNLALWVLGGALFYGVASGIRRDIEARREADKERGE